MKRLLIVGASVVMLGAATDASAQAMVCGPPANCTVSGMSQVCTEMWAYTLATMTIPGGYTNTLSSATGAATSCTVMGNVNTRTFRAAQPTTNTAAGGCNFAGNFDFGGGTNGYVCTIDQASGLPVELMEFSIEGEGEESDEESGPSGE